MRGLALAQQPMVVVGHDTDRVWAPTQMHLTLTLDNNPSLSGTIPTEMGSLTQLQD